MEGLKASQVQSILFKERKSVENIIPKKIFLNIFYPSVFAKVSTVFFLILDLALFAILENMRYAARSGIVL